MVILAQGSPSRRSARSPQSKTATVVLEPFRPRRNHLTPEEVRSGLGAFTCATAVSKDEVFICCSDLNDSVLPCEQLSLRGGPVDEPAASMGLTVGVM